MLILCLSLGFFFTLFGVISNLISWQFYIALIATCGFTIINMIYFYRSRKEENIQKLIVLFLKDVFNFMHAGSVSPIVAYSKIKGMRDFVVDIIISFINADLMDGSKKYWLYICLGKINGMKASSQIEKGLRDPDEFVRLGAEEASEIIKKHAEEETCWYRKIFHKVRRR